MSARAVSLLLALGFTTLVGCGGYDAAPRSGGSVPAGAAGAPLLPPPDGAAPAEKPDPRHNTEAYDRIVENDFLSAARDPLSTFSIDVDTASYSNVRRFLTTDKRLPPPDAVRIEELINYFPYAYAPPREGLPFATHVEVADCPWNKEHRLVRVGLKGREVARADRPPCNLVFLVDVSGSMNGPNRLPLVKRGLSLLVNELTEKDRVALVVYAAGTGVALPSTPASDRNAITAALDRLQAAGSTHGSAGIQLAYDEAQRNFLKEGVNRVILCTDGDFNVGVTGQGDLVRLIEERRQGGVFLTVLGFGMGNYKDATLVKLADHGNGNYAYIDTLNEARKVFVEQASGTLVTIAKDVKVQVEFNPTRVNAYRLIGYEKRLLQARDFNDDRKDAGEIGAGHAVTALYEVVPAGKAVNVPNVDPLKYQQQPKLSPEAKGPDLLTLKLRYKEPDGEQSKLIEFPVVDGGAKLAEASGEFRFAAAVAEFGLLLRQSQYQGEATYGGVRDLASGALGADPTGYRKEFLALVAAAERGRHLAHYFKFRTPADVEAEAQRLGLDLRFSDDLSPLFRPVAVGPLRAGNALCVQPMEGCDGTPDGRPDELTFRRYRRFGAGGAKLLWGEATAVLDEGRANPRQLLITDATAPDLERMLRECRRAHREAFGDDSDLVVGLQLTHSGRYSFRRPLLGFHDPILDPRTVADRASGRAVDASYPLLDDDYLRRLVGHYAAAAKLARKVGFDFVDVKQCHRYLLSELLAARTRPGPYGGSLENRTRLARDIIAAIRSEAPGLVVASRLNVYDGIPYRKTDGGDQGEPCPWAAPVMSAWGAGEADPFTPNLAEPLWWVGEMAKLGVALVNVSMGNPYATPHVIRPFEYPPPDGYETPEHPLIGVDRHFRLAAQVQRAYPHLPVVGSGYSYLQEFLPQAGAANVRDGRASFVGVGRAALPMPDFAALLRETGRLDRKRVCRTFSYCTALMRAKHNDLGQFATGCPPFDKEVYGPIWEEAKKK